jgi:hypothetical protein
MGQENTGVLMGVLQGFVILAILPITYFNTKWLFKRGKIKVGLREQPTEQLSGQSAVQLSGQLFGQPTKQPTEQPTEQPSEQPPDSPHPPENR